LMRLTLITTKLLTWILKVSTSLIEDSSNPEGIKLKRLWMTTRNP